MYSWSAGKLSQLFLLTNTLSKLNSKLMFSIELSNTCQLRTNGHGRNRVLYILQNINEMSIPVYNIIHCIAWGSFQSQYRFILKIIILLYAVKYFIYRADISLMLWCDVHRSLCMLHRSIGEMPALSNKTCVSLEISVLHFKKRQEATEMSCTICNLLQWGNKLHKIYNAYTGSCLSGLV